MKDYYNIKRVSNSSLSWFEVSPKYFRMRMDQEIEEEKEFIFKKGKYVHYYILEPNEFEKDFIFLDIEIPKSSQQKEFCDHVARFKKGTHEEMLIRAYKECYVSKEKDETILEKAKSLEKQFKDYIKSIKLSTVKVILPKNAMNKLLDIKSKLYDHKLARELLFNDNNSLFGNDKNLVIFNEFQILWESQDGIECKSMLDRVIIDHENKVVKLIDLKTSADFENFESKLFEYKYDRQLAFYWKALTSTLDIKDYKKETYIIAVNMKEPTEVKVFDVCENTLNAGNFEINWLLLQLKWHFDNEKWDYPKEYYEGNGAIPI
jgi:hypothetical protein